MTESHPHKQEQAAPRRRPAWLAPLLVVIGMGLGVGAMFSAFAAPSVHSGADDLPIAIGGDQQAVRALESGLARTQPGAFDLTTYGSADDVRRAIGDRDAVGGLVAERDGVTVYLASAAGSGYAQLLRGIGTGLTAQGTPVTYVDAAPYTADDPAGGGITSLPIPLIFGGMFSSALVVVVLKARGVRRAGVALAIAIVVGLGVAALLRFGFHTIDTGYAPTALAIGMGAAAISLTVMGLEAAIGSRGLALGAMLMMFLANPLSGIATGWQWLPSPWGLIGQLLPVGATGTAGASLLPEVFHAIWRWFDDFDWFGSTERAAAVFKNAHLGLLAG